jgi:hypothetical protein
MWDKSYGIALILFGSNSVIQILLEGLYSLFATKVMGLNLVVRLMTAYTVGQVYASKQGEAIPPSLNSSATAYYTLMEGILSTVLFCFLMANIPDAPWFFPLLGFAVQLLIAPLIYWAIGSGSKNYLKRMRR